MRRAICLAISVFVMLFVFTACGNNELSFDDEFDYVDRINVVNKQGANGDVTDKKEFRDVVEYFDDIEAIREDMDEDLRSRHITMTVNMYSGDKVYTFEFDEYNGIKYNGVRYKLDVDSRNFPTLFASFPTE